MVTGNLGFIHFINNYANLVSYGALLIPILGLALFMYFRNKMFSNSSPVAEVDGKETLLPSTELVGISSVDEDMYMDSDIELYTGVLETRGVAYTTFNEDEKDQLNGAYINFLRAINFPFSKLIVSRKIDIEGTEKQYLDAYDRVAQQLTLTQEILEKDPENKEALDREKLLTNDLRYLSEQLGYLEAVANKTQGTTKKVFYAVSGELDAEAVKGLSESEEVKAYAVNVNDRLSAMNNSLQGCGVRSKKLVNEELIDLARLYYKPFSSHCYKSKHLLKNVEVGAKYVFYKDTYIKNRIMNQTDGSES